MKVLLVGATGQIGYALTQALSKTGHQVSILVRDKNKLLFPASVRIIEFKEFTAAAFRQALVDVDHVIYGAGLPAQFLPDDTLFDRVNYALLERFLGELKDSKVRDLTYISTYEVFQDVGGLIRESHPLADERRLTPYFRSMVKAYRLVTEFAKENGVALGTIHPAAVYGGLNTGDGITNYLENLKHRRFWRVPLIVNGRFPAVHVASLADAAVKALGKPQAYIVSDQMTTLKHMALILREHTDSYVPAEGPLWMAKPFARFMGVAARALRTRPIASTVQIEFITKGWEPRPDKAVEELGWEPLPLEEGVKRYLEDTAAL
jgi:dihydroflavonol-4-reductase